MTDKQKENLIRLLKASNPASRNLGRILLDKSGLSEEDKRQIEKECAVAPGWRMLVTDSEYIHTYKPLTIAQFEKWMQEMFLNRKKTVKPKGLQCW